MAYVYRHRRLDTNEIFYIGISNSKKEGTHRASNKSSRNTIWKRIVNKTNYEIEIIADNIDIENAKELEVFLISLYGRIDQKTGTLTNLTEGGDGTTKPSQETIDKRRPSLQKTHAKKCVSFKSGTEYESLKEACRILGINYGWQKQAVLDQSPTALFYYKDNPFELRTTRYKESTIRKPTTAKITISFETGKIYPSLKEACKQENLNYGAQQTAIKRRLTTAKFYFQNDFFEIKTKGDIDENNKRKGKKSQD